MKSDQWSIRYLGPILGWPRIKLVLCGPLTTHFVGLGHFPILLRQTEVIMQGIIIDGRAFLCSKIIVEPITILLLFYAYDRSLD